VNIGDLKAAPSREAVCTKRPSPRRGRGSTTNSAGKTVNENTIAAKVPNAAKYPNARFVDTVDIANDPNPAAVVSDVRLTAVNMPCIVSKTASLRS